MFSEGEVLVGILKSLRCSEMQRDVGQRTGCGRYVVTDNFVGKQKCFFWSCDLRGDNHQSLK